MTPLYGVVMKTFTTKMLMAFLNCTFIWGCFPSKYEVIKRSYHSILSAQHPFKYSPSMAGGELSVYLDK